MQVFQVSSCDHNSKLLLQIGQFEDDAESSQFRTLLAHFPPGHILHEKHGLLPRTNHFIDVLFPSSVKDALVPGNCSFLLVWAFFHYPFYRCGVLGC